VKRHKKKSKFEIRNSKFVVLGGAGAMGREIVRELLALSPRHRVTVADTRTDFYAHQPPAWVKKFRRRLAWKKADLVREPAKLVRLLRGHTAMINATTHHLNLPAMRAALRARVHYIDLGGLFHYTRRQLKLHRAFERIQRLAILGMGCAPGMSNLLAVRAAEGMERVDSIEIKVGGKNLTTRKLSPHVVEVPYAIGTIREELMLKPWVFKGRRFRTVAPRTGREGFSFPPPVGKQTVFFTLHSEVATLPASFGARNVCFKIGFDPALMSALLHPSPNTRFVMPAHVKDVEITCAVVRGWSRGKRACATAYAVVRSRRGVSAGTMDTAIPPAIVASMLPGLEKTGVLPPERAVPAARFFRAARRRGIRIVRRNQSP